MATQFDAREWFMKLRAENRFAPKKKTVEGKSCYVVNTGFVSHYGGLSNEAKKRQVRAFLLKSFKSPACKHPEFSKMTDAQLKAFMEAQEAYAGRQKVKEATGKRKVKDLPPIPESSGSFSSLEEKPDDTCKAYGILNSLLDGMFEELEKVHKLRVDTSITREQQKLMKAIKSCVALKPEPGLYEPMIVFIGENLPQIELSGPFLKHLRSFPPDLKKVRSFVGSIQRETKVLYKLKAKRGGGSMRKTKKLNKQKILSKKNKKH